MRILEVRAGELRCQPQRFGVRDLAQLTGLLIDDFRLLAFNVANVEICILAEDLVTVQVVEGLCGVLASDLCEDDVAAGMCVEEVGQIVDLVVDNDPKIIFAGVL